MCIFLINSVSFQWENLCKNVSQRGDFLLHIVNISWLSAHKLSQIKIFNMCLSQILNQEPEIEWLVSIKIVFNLFGPKSSHYFFCFGLLYSWLKALLIVPSTQINCD